MNLHKILGVEAHWNINKSIAKEVGIEGALLLAHLISFSSYFGKNGKLIKTKFGDGFFSQTSKQIENETFIGRRGQEKAIKILKKAGFIEQVLAGNPAKKHFRILSENILNFLVNSEKEEIKENKEDSLLNKFVQNVQTKENDKQDCTENPNKFVQNKQTIYKEEKEINKNNINSNELIENQKKYSYYKFSENEKIESSEDEFKKNHFEEESLKKSSAENSNEESEIIIYGKKEINDILEFLKKTIGVSDFKETQKMQRIWGKNIFCLGQKIGKEDFIFRLKNILKDGFKAKNCNSLKYLYGELKSFIHSPLVEVEPENKKRKVTFSG